MRYRLNAWEGIKHEDYCIGIILYYETDTKEYEIERIFIDMHNHDEACSTHVDTFETFDEAFADWWFQITHEPIYYRDCVKRVELRKARETMDAVKKLPARQLYFEI